MENARLPRQEEPSAKSTQPILPTNYTSVLADVFAKMLQGRRLTGLDAWLEAGTSRLAAHIHRLRHEYGWKITTADKDVPTKDGRTVKIAEYWLDLEQIEAVPNRDEYIERVSEARAAQRIAARG